VGRSRDSSGKWSSKGGDVRTIAKTVTMGLIWLLAACAVEPPFAQQVANRPLPRTEPQRIAECRWLDSERSKQQSLATSGPAMATSPEASILYGPVGRRNLAAIEARVGLIGCGKVPDDIDPAAAATRTPPPGAVPSAASDRAVDRPPADDRRPPAAEMPSVRSGATTDAAPAAVPRVVPDDATFDACFRRCRTYTDRSKEQCFDTCYR